MKKPNLKLDLRFSLGFLRKYTAIVIPVIIVIVAGLFLGMAVFSGRRLKAAIQKNSLQLGNQIKGMVGSTPSSQQYTLWQEREDLHQKEAERVAQFFALDSRRELISYKVFPEPKDKSNQMFDEFGKLYQDEVEKLVRMVNGRDAPTVEEIQAQLGGGVRPGGGINYSTGSQEATKQMVIDKLCEKRAQEISVYAAPQLFPWSNYWHEYKFEGRDKAIEHCWYSQMAYWVYEDVMKSIARINEGSISVYTSPVKRLIGITFKQHADYIESRNTLRVSAMSKTSVMEDRPDYVREGFPTVLGVKPWTERWCNEKFDVFHFSVGVVVSAGAVDDFMVELCSAKTHNFREGYVRDGRLQEGLPHNSITILQSQIDPVERSDDNHKFYRYGAGAVVQLTLVCEYLLGKEGYASIVPETVKTLLETQAEKRTGTTRSTGVSGSSKPTGSSKPSSTAGSKARKSKRDDIGID
ncbi:MAG: hypothetical protein JXA82_09945 [Sedimentisphaerales bacterium]|nr:hypothetical protein [Sedimentisphaerales bacterium]